MFDKVKIKEWVEALESGKYKQIRSELKRDGGFCCIGVLGHINNVDYDLGSYLSNDAYNLCNNITGRGVDLFWEMNDVDQRTFPEIASEIRKMYNIT